MIPVIGIDARKARDFGIGTYTRELVGAIGRRPEAADFRFTLFVRPGDERLFSSLPAPFAVVAETAPGYTLREIFGFGRRIRRARLDLFHALHYVLPAGIGTRAVVTVHDRIHLDFPGDGAPLRYPYARTMLAGTLARSAAVITASEAVRRDLAELAPEHAGKIESIPHGVAEAFRPDVPAEEIAGVRSRLGLPPVYALYLGGAKPHKNLSRVVEAFRRVRADDLALVAAGPLPPPSAAERGEPRIRRTGVVDETDLPALYRGAAFLLYPTLAEGFGLPLLEAMASGVPAIVSDIPAFREVAGGAARLVDPLDPAAIARAIEEVAGNPSLRADLAARGLARAREFSWDRAAERTLAVYRRVLEAR